MYMQEPPRKLYHHHLLKERVAYTEHLEGRIHGMLFLKIETGSTKKSSANKARCRQARRAGSTTSSTSEAAETRAAQTIHHRSPPELCLQPASQTEMLPLVKIQRPSSLWRVRCFQANGPFLFQRGFQPELGTTTRCSLSSPCLNPPRNSAQKSLQSTLVR